MSEDMIPSGSTWNSKHLVSATSRLTSLKGFVASHTPSPPTRYNWSGSGGGTARGLGGSSEGEHEKKGWRAWAGQKIRGKKVKGDDDVGNTEVINVFPGWAARRYAQGSTSEGSFLQITCPHLFKSSKTYQVFPRPFEVEVFVSGYAISYRPPEKISRSQKAFIRLAKG